MIKSHLNPYYLIQIIEIKNPLSDQKPAFLSTSTTEKLYQHRLNMCRQEIYGIYKKYMV